MISNTTRHKSLATTLVSAPLDPLQSSLQIGSGGGIEKLLLELIYCQRMKTRQDLDSFVVCTLMNVQHPPLQVDPRIAFLSFLFRSKNGFGQPSLFYSSTNLSLRRQAPLAPRWNHPPYRILSFKSEQLHSAVLQLFQGSLLGMP